MALTRMDSNTCEISGYLKIGKDPLWSIVSKIQAARIDQTRDKSFKIENSEVLCQQNQGSSSKQKGKWFSKTMCETVQKL